MEIRPASEQDIPAIVVLLKLSLGEDLMPKSEAYWRWKHVDNPFGPSPVLLAFDKDLLVGVRAFMRWRWRLGNEVFEAVRAVDTATHPEYQGKGIFKKLTLTLLEKCRQEGFHFVFNTPNKSSMPGYIKMGWEEGGKLPVKLKCVKPLSMMLHVAGWKGEGRAFTGDNPLKELLKENNLENVLLSDRAGQKGIITDHSPASLKWRYHDVSVAQYFGVGIEKGGALRAAAFYRVKNTKAGNELRVTDVFMESAAYKNDVAALLQERMKMHDAEYMTLSAAQEPVALRGLVPNLEMRIGPMVTLREMNAAPMDKLRNFNQWRPSLGDLELF
ncbi:GNAT family N-acetyltransferase [Chryseolinea soli]|uniref:GNAT family N-acetyltransferase n=1 Tax=Chryseolinea soli TaxID=2321403 RepID=A0A385SSZ8_9BACT|nr:GNAT family N-acetyltransferase [Chryseolinea soli]AYB33115.1 GNAT family N-acetyltransferase [Chryseolinea soli]